jgi:nitrite reductase (NADH) small subunit
MKQVVCRREELGPGQMLVAYKGRAPVVVVCSSANDYYAVRGICPHQGGMLGAGQLTSLTAPSEPGIYELIRHGEVLRCPWHSFDFDVKTGRCISDPSLRIKTYAVHVEGVHLVVDL